MSYIDIMINEIEDKIYEKEIKNLRHYKEMYDKVISDFFVIDRDLPTEISYYDLFMQSDARSRSNKIVVGHIIYQFHFNLINQYADLIAVPVKQKPSADKKHIKNKEKLNKIPSVFKCELVFKNYIGDGAIYYTVDDKPRNNMFYKSNQCQLEVGTTNPETLYWHMLNNGSFARWPYNSKWLYIYTLKEKQFFNLKKSA